MQNIKNRQPALSVSKQCTGMSFVGSKSDLHWNENVIILMKFSSLAAPKVVILTTFGVASDEDFIKMKTFSFQCMVLNCHCYPVCNNIMLSSNIVLYSMELVYVINLEAELV